MNIIMGFRPGNEAHSCEGMVEVTDQQTDRLTTDLARNPLVGLSVMHVSGE